ncbi:ATP-binding protein [Brevundimonas sp. NIBR11]|uniref:PAS domain-containing sensor histidine kinase n=1 Tax=Brevundimonas sp. NIBR11 TaxID=3015999 RepID=UPI0022F1380B|nr:ATP-binding protein [Brevundimonas sp. NIBR11]WGM30592.1 Adaptive-response sensory-kinase SasA [Brevundimonas sp. NIBR11]
MTIPPTNFEVLFEDAPCGYLILGADGVITRANATVCGWIGKPSKELVGRRLRDLLSLPGRIYYETNVLPRLRLRGRIEEVVLDLLTEAGETLPVLVNATEQRDASGEVVGIRVAVFRASERRSVERNLRGRLDDERSTAELREQFIAVLGHDLRNPLASIVGAARLLKREAPNEKALGVLRLMETSVDRMAGLIDDVMDFARSRLGSGIDLHRSIEPLEPVLRQVVRELEVDEPSRTLVCAFDLPDPVSFDPGRMAQLVSNLLGNALVHGDPRQPIRLSARTAEGVLEISVANAGDAIPPAALDRLFQPFFRGEVRANQQGLGLGLHIASEIARAHEGTLRAVSDAAETRFILTMPTLPSPPLPIASDRPASGSEDEA